jgi:hypothetical protein
MSLPRSFDTSDAASDYRKKPGKGGKKEPAAFGGLMADMARWGVVFAPPDEGAGGSEASAPDETPPAKPESKAKPKSEPKPEPKSEADPSEALRGHVAELERRLKSFGDATPDEIKELREIRAKAEAERKAAETAARKAEEERLRKEGDFETLKQRMADEHQKELEAVRGQSSQLDQTVAALTSQIEQMALSTAFASSRFVQEDTIIGPDKARRIYGAHFDVVDGTVVGYDAPRGATKRVALVDGKGVFLPFDEAIKRLVDGDPDRDRLLKAQQKPGTGAAPSRGVTVTTPAPEVRGAARLARTLPTLMGRTQQ